MRIRQGPLQRLFGLAELEVHTAGGGGKATEDGASRNLHVGHFRGLENAWALRDRLRGALARHRASGLGDPDEDRSPPPDDRDVSPARGLLPAAETLLAEARRLRAALREDS